MLKPHSSSCLKRDLPEHDSAKDALGSRPGNNKDSDELEYYKRLYYELQNLDDHPAIIDTARVELIKLLAQTLQAAKLDTNSGILSIEEYSRSKLAQFLAAQHEQCTTAWEQYIHRRRSGGAREMFKDVDDAKWWLKNSAPVKFVDGAWLGHISKITTPFSLRKITKNAWQIMSEELGDGDLKKNHVYVYERLLEATGAGLPAGWTRQFINPEHQLNEIQCWKAAVAQLLISLFPHEFLPEILGFNMAYEGLPLHLLKTTKELRELDIDNYYFMLHISIDNADSGHAAMAMEVVTDYIDKEIREHGNIAGEVAWRRVQAGFVLAEGLPTIPETGVMKTAPRFPCNKLETQVLKVFSSKAGIAHRIHCSSRIKIGEETLVDWLEPKGFSDATRQSNFIESLAECKPWVYKGDSKRSKLVQELRWNGRMYGAYTEAEANTLCNWIDSLGSVSTTIYYEFTSRTESDSKNYRNICSSDISAKEHHNMGMHNDSAAIASLSDLCLESDLECLALSTCNMLAMIPLWFSSLALLENFANVPSRIADEMGSAIIRVQRAQLGFDYETDMVAGMDEFHKSYSCDLVEIGLGLCTQYNEFGPDAPQSLDNIFSCRFLDNSASKEIIALSKTPFSKRGRILGMSYAFAKLHHWMAASNYQWFADQSHKILLARIAVRELEGLQICLEIESSLGGWGNIVTGFLWAQGHILQSLSS